MGFLNPIFFTFTIFIGLFILLYFFRKEFESKVIPSNMLWEQVMQEWESSPWFDRLQKNLLFWLQLFALLFLLFSLVKPFWYGEGEKGEHLIFVVDSSATMSVMKEDTDLFTKQKEQMKAIVSNLQNQRVTVIVAGSRPEIVLRDEENKNVITDSINDLSISYEHENLELALQLADGLADEKTAIHLFTDGTAIEDVAEIIEDTYLMVHNLNEMTVNISLKSLGIGQTANGIGGIAVIENQSDSILDVQFILKSEDETLYEDFFTIAAKEEEFIFIDQLPAKEWYKAEIITEDDYQVDNSQTAVYMESTPPVYVIGDVNPFLIRGLESVGVEVFQLAEEDHVDSNSQSVILTNVEAYLETPTNPLIYVENNQRANTQLEGPLSQTDDPLLQYVDFTNVFIQRGIDHDNSGLEPIVKRGDTPIIEKGAIDGFPIVAIRFPIEQSDWPLHANFPIFLFNSYEWLTRQANYLGYFQPGEARWVNIGKGENEIAVFNESGENIHSFNIKETAFKAPNEPGLYQALVGDDIFYFSVILDERERGIKSQPSFVLHEELLEDENVQGEIIFDQLWFWLAIAALILLAIEWEVYRRNASI